MSAEQHAQIPKVLVMVILYSKCTRALTFHNSECAGGGACGAGAQAAARGRGEG